MENYINTLTKNENNMVFYFNSMNSFNPRLKNIILFNIISFNDFIRILNNVVEQINKNKSTYNHFIILDSIKTLYGFKSIKHFKSVLKICIENIKNDNVTIIFLNKGRKEMNEKEKNT
jgi:hypothetical protein